MSGHGAQQRDPETRATKHGPHDKRSMEGSGYPESSVGGRMCWNLWVHPEPSVCSYCSCILCLISVNKCQSSQSPSSALYSLGFHWVPVFSADNHLPLSGHQCARLVLLQSGFWGPPASQSPGQLTQDCEVYMRGVFFPLCLQASVPDALPNPRFT